MDGLDTRMPGKRLVCRLALACASRCAAGLIAYEDLEAYAPGVLNGLNGGSGFDSAFVANASSTVHGYGMSYSNGEIRVDGGTNCIRVISPGTSGYTFGRMIPVQTNDLVYMSLLFETPTGGAVLTGTTADDYFGIGLNNQAGEPTAGVVQRLNNGAFKFALRYGTSQVFSSFVTTTNRTYFVVFRLRKLTPGATSPYNELALFVDPSSTNEPVPTLVFTNSRWAAATYLTARNAADEAGDCYYVDSLRLTSTYADAVLPVEDLSQVAQPLITPAGGLFTNSVVVAMSCATPGASVRYTTDGSVPSPLNGTTYTDPFALTRTARVRARAFLAGKSDSAVAAEDFGLDADLAVEETFEDYEAGGLSGLAGGSGFLGAYSSESFATIVDRSMQYASGAIRSDGGGRALCVSSGNSNGAVFYREFYARGPVTLYMGLLYEQTMDYAAGDTDEFVSFGVRYGTVDQPYTGIFVRPQFGAFKLGIRYSTTQDQYSSFAVAPNTVNFAVIKMEKTSGLETSRYDRVSLYVNPSSRTEPATPDATIGDVLQNTYVNLISLRTYMFETGDACYIDNFRLGRTFESVLPPRESTRTLLLLR